MLLVEKVSWEPCYIRGGVSVVTKALSHDGGSIKTDHSSNPHADVYIVSAAQTRKLEFI